MLTFLLTALAFGASPEATCTARASWTARHGDAAAAVAEGRQWTDTQTGPEADARAALLAACEAARTAPDPDGWTKTDLSSCEVTCGPPRGTGLVVTASTKKGAVEVLAQPLARVKTPLRRCFDRTETATPPLDLKATISSTGMRLAKRLPDATLSDCVDQALRRVDVDGVDAVGAVTLHVAWSE